MASSLNPAFAYTVVYVKDVAKSTAFYSKAFGYAVRRIDESRRCKDIDNPSPSLNGESLKVGRRRSHSHRYTSTRRTTSPGTVQRPSSGNERQPVEVCFDYPDVDAAYKRAVENGTVAVTPPEEKEWGQKVGCVRDPAGIVARMGSYVNEPKHS